jgi:DNA (cytosine-5)-methyltransferase 1
LSRLSGKEIRALTGLGERRIHVLLGGSPCQGFSLIGKRLLEDPRNLLLYDFARLVRELRPSYFVVENVEGLLLGDSIKILQSFLRRIKRAGYSTVTPIKVLDASDFGVPQRRRRVFILGYINGLPVPEYPMPLFDNNNKDTSYRPTVWDAIGDLPNIDEFDYLLETDVYSGDLAPASYYARILRGEIHASEDKSRVCRKKENGLTGCLRTEHTRKAVRRFVATKPGEHEPVSRFYRLPKDGLAPTLRAGTDQSRGSFTAARPIHPVYPRCISVREAARLHSFPDYFYFHPTKWHGFRQVGNSVPPFLAKAVGKAVEKALSIMDR